MEACLTLPRRLKQKKNRSGRWRSARHCDFVRDHACCVPGCNGGPIEVAHLRVGTDAATGRKASDWFTISLCFAHHRGGEDNQHSLGEPSFEKKFGIDLHALAAEFAEKSPKAADIRLAQRARALEFTCG